MNGYKLKEGSLSTYKKEKQFWTCSESGYTIIKKKVPWGDWVINRIDYGNKLGFTVKIKLKFTYEETI